MVKLKYITYILFSIVFSKLHAQVTTTIFDVSSGIEDATIMSNSSTQNFGSGGSLDVLYMAPQGQNIPISKNRALIKFDLSNIPVNAIVTEATLKLFPKSFNNQANKSIILGRVYGSNWQESGLNWNNQPSIKSTDSIVSSLSQININQPQEFDVWRHVQQMVYYPNLNEGWKIKFQNESGNSGYNLTYHSSESTNSNYHPVLEVKYVMPLDLNTSITHCTAGNSDGSLSATLSGGGTTIATNSFRLYSITRNLNYDAKATLANVANAGLSFNALTKVLTANNLNPGAYIIQIKDPLYNVHYVKRHYLYKYILIGRAGELTKAILMPHPGYNKHMMIQNDKPNATNPTDKANTNFYTGNGYFSMRIEDIPNNRESASLFEYNIDFDNELEFSKAQFIAESWAGGFFRHNNSSNKVNYKLITEPWERRRVTWNTRPTVQSANQLSISTTNTIGYDPLNVDTISLLSFVQQWQSNPESNYGFEVALDNYNNAQFAERSYFPNKDNRTYFELEFTVKSAAVTSFDDGLNNGTITVESPQGVLPYSYLINTSPIGSLSDVWNGLDTDIIDSATFFQGDVNSTTYTFSDLPSGHYYIAVYDNNGTKIMDETATVNAEIKFTESNGLVLNLDKSITLDANAQNSGSARLLAELGPSKVGGLNFELLAFGEFYVGFNKSSDNLATSANDFEFGIKIGNNGAYQIVKDNLLQQSVAGNIALNSKIDLIKEYTDFVLYINNTEVYRYQPTNFNSTALSIDILHSSLTAKWMPYIYWGKFKKPGVYLNTTYPECGAEKGSLSLSTSPQAKILSCTLTNNEAGGPNPAGAIEVTGNSAVFFNIPIGTYTLVYEYEYTSIFGGVTIYHIEEQIAIGYVVEWEAMVNNIVSPLNTIKPSTYLTFPTYATANSTNVTYEGFPNWVQFETDVLSGPFGLSHSESIEFKNLSGDHSFSTSHSNFWVFNVSASYNQTDGLGMSYLLAGPPNGVWRIEQDGNNYQLFKNGTTSVLPSGGTSDVPGPFELSIRQTGKPRYIKTIASFCAVPKNDFIAKTKVDVDGGYFITNEGKLMFQYTGEYNQSNLEYILTNEAGQEIDPLLYGVEVISIMGEETKKNADNRFSLNFLSLPAGFYTLKVINIKGDEHFIRIKR